MKSFTVGALKNFIKDIPDDVEVGIYGWMGFQSLTEPKRITHGKFVKEDKEVLMIWEPGAHLFEEKGKYEEYNCDNGRG